MMDIEGNGMAGIPVVDDIPTNMISCSTVQA